jgi:hypothetical protein
VVLLRFAATGSVFVLAMLLPEIKLADYTSVGGD